MSILVIPWWQAFLSVLGFFSLLYFGSSLIAQWVSCKLLPHLGLGQPIGKESLKQGQIRNEIVYSLQSICIFALYGVIIQYLVIQNILHVSTEHSVLRILLECIALFLWNEIHFYVCHRLLHLKWLYKHVHAVHHGSVCPTPFSTFSFHIVEAILLGSVMLIAMCFHAFDLVSLACLPIMSIILNTLGHFNYDMFPHKPIRHMLAFTRRHSLHHSMNIGNFGFFLAVLDDLFHTEIKNKHRR